MGRVGKLFACDYEDVKPDMIVIGKSLGGGCYPISAVLANREILGVFKPGEHGSTFGGNPLACAVAREAIRVTREEKLVENAAELGEYFLAKLRTIKSKHIKEIRGRGLLIGVELHPEAGGARRFCEELMKEGLLCKETHENVIRFAPPLVMQGKGPQLGLQTDQDRLQTSGLRPGLLPEPDFGPLTFVALRGQVMRLAPGVPGVVFGTILLKISMERRNAK